MSEKAFLKPPVEQFPALESIGTVLHGFVTRVPGLDFKTDRATALVHLESWHAAARQAFGQREFRTASQVHGSAVAFVSVQSPARTERADGLITNDPGVLLGIYVADCCAVFLVDPRRRAIGLVHSGRKGSELNIVSTAMRQMELEFGSDPTDIVAQLSPCIRPPLYEIDFAATIVNQLRELGVQRFNDSGVNTGANVERYYSYRVEKGQTGRMLALLALK